MPHTYTVTETHCFDCEFHTQNLWRSGREPVYHHFCKHPKFRRQAAEQFNVPDGAKFIGRDDVIPQWCPLLEV